MTLLMNSSFLFPIQGSKMTSAEQEAKELTQFAEAQIEKKEYKTAINLLQDACSLFPSSRIKYLLEHCRKKLETAAVPAPDQTHDRRGQKHSRENRHESQPDSKKRRSEPATPTQPPPMSAEELESELDRLAWAQDSYAVLKVKRDAPDVDMIAAYKALCNLVQPVDSQREKAGLAMEALGKANSQLSNPSLCEAYNEKTSAMISDSKPPTFVISLICYHYHSIQETWN